MFCNESRRTTATQKMRQSIVVIPSDAITQRETAKDKGRSFKVLEIQNTIKNTVTRVQERANEKKCVK